MLQDGILVLALVMDAFLACFAYGVEEIEILLGSRCLMGAIGTGVLLLSMGLFSLFLHPVAILLAYRLGKSAAGKLPAGCGAVGGMLLMALAISKLC